MQRQKQIQYIIEKIGYWENNIRLSNKETYTIELENYFAKDDNAGLKEFIEIIYNHYAKRIP